MTDVIYCNRCGTQNSALAKFCANCGSPFGSETTATAAIGPEVTPRPQGPADPATAAPSEQPPYAAPVYSSPAPAARYGGFWIRFVAAIIDALALGIVVWPVSGMLALMIGVAGGRVDMPGIGIHLVRGIVIWTMFLCAGWIYEAAMESSSKQATLGKMALRLKVTDEHGSRISFARASARYFSKILSRMILMIGYIMAGFTARKQALHDMIAGTLVVRTQ
ncbi:MAG: RDD family protein [Acidobacteria bacterium]|jgi:uncharacterized RDD family membrane protein YckC|nr:MAG: RDD family protein [Acidobacteriota bacterium]